MGIFSRTRDIVAANINDLLDKAEDPAKMIRLVIAEMEETLVEVRASAARAIADQKEMRRTIQKLEAAQASWAEKAELALSKGRDDLAKAALIEKAKLGQLAQATQGQIAIIDEALNGYEADIAKLESKLREARARQSSVLTRLQTAEGRWRLRTATAGPRIDDAFARFEMMERRVDMAESRVEAFDLGRTKTLDEEIAELKTNDAVEAELAALKARMGSQEA